MKTNFERDGYVVLPRVIDRRVADSVRAAMEALCAQISRYPEQWSEEVLYQRECRPSQLAHLAGDVLSEAQDQIYIISNLTRHLPEVKRLLLSPQLVGISEAALGETVRFHFSNLTLRAAHVGCGNAWHRDFPNQFCCGADERQLRLFICLDGMAEKQGAVLVAVGSHRWPEAQWNAFKSGPEAEALGSVATVECPPGSVVALHCRTGHAVLPNVSDQRRANVIAQYGARSNPVAIGAPELG